MPRHTRYSVSKYCPQFLAICILFVLVLFGIIEPAVLSAAEPQPLPNILWLTCEDIGPHLGCYGDTFAVTPTLNQLATEGMRYATAWSNAPVCAAARTTIITGLYAHSMGAQHMRSMTAIPENIKLYPQLLREKGYYCTNNSKEDYNVPKPAGTWDDSSGQAHWRNRKPGQPFFAIFNFTDTHESQMRNRAKLVGDPSKVRIPLYHPDTPESRHNWTLYYDRIAEMDAKCQTILDQLKADGLYENTIIIFFGDHGSGLPRNKRFPYNSGLHVPMLVRIPDAFKHLAPPEYVQNGVSSRLVSFVDLAPTLLSLIGEPAAPYHEGFAFLGKHISEPKPYIFGFRDRMDERYDLIRTVRNEKFVYVRNYYPHFIQGRRINFMFQTPTTVVWKQLFDEGKLNAVQSAFWLPKSTEELYDLTTDPDETRNLAALPEFAEIRTALAEALDSWEHRIRDTGFLPEGMIHQRAAAASLTPYQMKQNKTFYDFDAVHAAATLASDRAKPVIAPLGTLLESSDDAVRYWAAVGLLMRADSQYKEARPFLLRALKDSSPYVQIPAAHAMAEYGDAEDSKQGLDVLVPLCSMAQHDPYETLLAHNAIYEVSNLEKLVPYTKQIEAFPTQTRGVVPARFQEYNTRAITSLLERLNPVP